MASAEAPLGRARDPAPLRRRPERGLIGGVCAGIAEHFRVDVIGVRLLMAMFVAVGGIGIALYALGWALIPISTDSKHLSRRRGAWLEAIVIVVAVGAMFIALRSTGLRFGDAIVWPLVLGICGMALVWRPIVSAGGGYEERLSLRGGLRRLRRIDAPRLILGSLLVVFAAAGLLHTVGVQHSIGKAVGAVAIVTTILALLLGPWLVRMGRNLASERAARIREQERAEVAAHLHDSVLQTLALIQKRAGDPREVAGLARRQERELRHWLQERPTCSEQDSVAVALERAAAEVEELHKVPIEVVTVGDGPLDIRLEAMVQAAREAMTNAAKFASSERVDLYAEVAGERVEVFVRDRGVGFDPDAIPDDRRGVRDSIIGRMERHHGSAAVHSRPGEGTEVELVMERGAPA